MNGRGSRCVVKKRNRVRVIIRSEFMLQKIKIVDFVTTAQQHVAAFDLSYELFGQPLHDAPIVMVNHALTGNSTVCGETGWWKGLIGKGKCIDTDVYTVLAFNIPGNGYGVTEEEFQEDYKLFTPKDIAAIFLQGLAQLDIKKIYAVIGGSVGGGITWELAVQHPTLIMHLIPVATDWKSTDWLKANCLVQEQILLNSKRPVHDARLHAMLIYRTPASFKHKFDRSYNHEKGMYNIESWLFHHGEKLTARFELEAYKRLNYILGTIDITAGKDNFLEIVAPITATIHIISVDSDLFFTEAEDRITYNELKKINKNVTHGVINSVHGHDAFLIEFDQLTSLLKNVFKN